jgi:HPt (histidine-containing phosphotransfer) domain-containing protein
MNGGGAHVAIPEEDTLAPLKEVMAPQAFRELVELYELTIKGALAGIADAASRRELPAMRSHAHDLAGMCGQTGAARAVAAARGLERACVDGREDEALRLAARMPEETAEVLAALARLGAAGRD